MKLKISLLLALCIIATGLSVVAADKKDESEKKKEEPAALTQARKAYRAQANSAIDPIKKKYLAQLEELKKQLGGKGDLEGATAVQKEIETIAKEPPIQKEKGGGKEVADVGLSQEPKGESNQPVSNNNVDAEQTITVFTAGDNIDNFKTIISRIDKDIEINTLQLDTETLKSLKEQCKGKILVVLNNGLRGTNIQVFNKGALDGLSKFVSDGGCLVIFEQWGAENTALLDGLFKIKVEGVGGKGIIVDHKDIKKKLDQEVTSNLFYEEINFYNKYDAPRAKTIITTQDHKTKIGIIVPFKKGTVVLMGITLDQNPSLNLLNTAVFDYLIHNLNK